MQFIVTPNRQNVSQSQPYSPKIQNLSGAVLTLIFRSSGVCFFRPSM